MAISAPLPVVTIDEQDAPTVNRNVSVSATLAANEALAERRRLGERVLALAFGEAGVPVAPVLRDALATASDRNGYGPVAGSAELRAAAAGYWTRRGGPWSPRRIAGQGRARRRPRPRSARAPAGLRSAPPERRS